jgi:Fe-S-cluster containining protein
MDPRDADPPAPPPDGVADGLRFVHLMEMQTKARVAELSARLEALVGALAEAGQLPVDAYRKHRRLAIARENERDGAEATVDIADVADKYAVASRPVDCAARLPLCRARCCAREVTLSVQDLDERVLRWDYARPYRLARRPDGYCAHLSRGACGAYDARPGACRAYDCRDDPSIWLDFDTWIPAP